VLKVVKEGKNRKPFRMPKECPECGSKIHKVEGEGRRSCVSLRECGVPRKAQGILAPFCRAACNGH